MVEISFYFNNAITKIQCNTDDKVIDICKKISLKIEEDIDDIYFLYNGSKVDLSNDKLRVGELINNIDKSNKIMKMIVNKNNSTIINNNYKYKSKDIICGKCFRNSRIKIKDYKITLFECGNGHVSSDIFFKDFENIQYIDESKIKCGICKTNNKAGTYENKFFKCKTCKLNLCPICKNNHNNKDYIIDFDQNNYYCDSHDELYNSYCNTCKKNICVTCIKAHKNHEILSYSYLFPEETTKKKELDKFRNLIDKLKNEIKKIKLICDNFIENIEIYYTIYSDIINNYNYNNKNRNYQILKNINDINDKNIINDINEIISLKDKSLKFSKINNIYNKMRIRFIKNEKESKNNFKKIDTKNNFKKIDPKNNKKTHKRNKTANRNNINDDNFLKTYNNRFYNEKFEKKLGINNIKDIKRKIDKDTIKDHDDIKNKTEENFMPKIENEIIILNNNIERTNQNPLINDKRVPIFKPIKDANEISIIYKIDQNDKNKGEVKIFGFNFVLKNKKKCYIIHNNINYDLTEYFNIKDIKENTFEIKLIDIRNITNISNMFNKCSSLISIKDISNWNTSNIEDMGYLFYGCSSLSNFSGISEWDTRNVINMSYLFSSCAHLEKLPDISTWDTSSVIAMSNLFNGCSSLKELPDISKWNTINVKDMNGLFNNCSSLEKLPDISKWNTSNVFIMSNLFNGCSSLKEMPDISKWNTNNVNDMSNMFSGCNSLSSLPKISIVNLENKENIFSGCSERLVPKK